MKSTNGVRIVFVVPSAYLLGGVQVWLAYLVNALNNKGYNSICAAVDGKYHVAQNYLDYYGFEHTAVISNASNTRWGRVRAIADVIKATQADVVVSVNIPDSFEATQLARQEQNRRVTLLATLHGLEPDYFADLDYAHQYLDAVVVTNKLTALAVQEFTSIPQQKIYYAPYGVSIPKTSARLADEGSGDKSRNALTILYSGRIENDQKRCQDLVGIAVELQNKGVPFKLLIAGDGEYRSTLAAELAQHLTDQSYAFLGFVGRDELLTNVLPVCDAMIITSSWETGPIVAWEAMAAGVTLVSSRYLGAEQEEALADGVNCLLFDIGDVAAAARALSKVQDVELRNRLNSEALKLIAQRYTIEKSVEAFATVLQQVIMKPMEDRPPAQIGADWPTTGRLEQWFGHRLGHKLRSWFGKPAYCHSAGTEWPHTLGYSQWNNDEFKQRLRALKR